MSATTTVAPADSPEVRRYNRIRRWLGIAEFLLGLALLVVILLTGWTSWLRDLAYSSGFQSYPVAVFLYTLMLVVISKVLMSILPASLLLNMHLVIIKSPIVVYLSCA